MSEESQPEPDWALLADDPEAFFELQDGWGRRDLRRAYGAWIKRFKPDVAPDEFRRIRAAFERLEDELRFGQAQTAVPQEQLHTESREPVQPPPGLPEREDFLEAMRTLGPSKFLAETVARHPGWWAPRYLRLFLDGDEFASDEVFQQHLVSALQAAPREPFLLGLTRAWVRHRVGSGEGLDLLKAFEGLPDMTMASVATPLLRELAREGRGDQLAAILQRLERSVDREGQIAFAAVLEDCLLAASMVVEPRVVAEWLDAIELDPRGRFDFEDVYVEAASRILAWRRARALAEKGDQGPRASDQLVEELTRALMELATGDEAARMTTLLQLGARIRSSHREILGCLEPGDSPLLALIDALELFGLPFDHRKDQDDDRQMQALTATSVFVQRLTHRIEASVLGRLWTLLALAAWTLTALALALLFSPLTALWEWLVLGAEADETALRFGWLAPLLGIGMTVIISTWRRSHSDPLGPVSRILRRAEQALSLRLYRTHWRGAICDFVPLQPWSGPQLSSVLRELDEGDGSTVSTLLFDHLAADPAPRLILFGRDLDA